MKKFLVVLVLAAVGGALVYRYVLATPEARVCSRMAELCDQDRASCERQYGGVRKALGPEALERAADCLDGSETCAEAVACTATGLSRDFVEQIGKGIERSLEQK
jgi:hypothetical protein